MSTFQEPQIALYPVLLVSENCTRDHLFQIALGIMCLPAQNVLHLKCSGKSYRNPCNFKNAQVALR